jgi:ketosteroid isomerase-like protein
LSEQSRGRGRPRARQETVERLFEAFNRRDMPAALGLLHPDLVFEPVSATAMGHDEPYRGHDGIRRYFADITEHWQELTVNPVHVRAAGDAVVALGQTKARGRGGLLDDVPTTWVFKFEQDLVVHIQVFSDERLARAALGLDA